MRRNSDNRCNYFHFIFHSFSVHCHQKALDPLKVNWHYANWGWSNVDYLDNDSGRSHLLHCSTYHCNLPLQVDQLQPSSHVWDHIQKNWRGEKPKGNHWGTSFCWIPKVPSTNNWRLLKNSKWNPNKKPSMNTEKNNQKIKLKFNYKNKTYFHTFWYMYVHAFNSIKKKKTFFLITRDFFFFNVMT